MARLQIDAVSKRFGTDHAVREVSLDIADGEFLVLLGPSGCGKSTLLRMIAGLEQPSAGRILLDGSDITDEAPPRRDLAMVFQSYALYPHLSVARNIGFPLRARRRSRAEIDRRVREVAGTLELSELLERRPAALSGGQRQRVALARAMVRDPGAFLMDEPLSNLDAKLRSATRAELIGLHRRRGATFLYVTHDQVEAMTMATRIALLNAGQVEQVGTPEELYDTPRTAFVAGFLGSPPMNLFPAEVFSREGALRVRADGIDAALGLDGGPEDAATVLAGIRPERLRLDPAATAVRGRVSMVENLGSEELVHVTAGAVRLCVRAPRPVGVAVGQDIGLRADPADIHLFDPASGLRMTWREPESVIPDATASVA
ncbi:ABC transporter ATP-binding protein [Nocardia seriolae]|uniref:Trehalose import ATP-binding protein SugC n=1 Tax=Nocardia seriolae TaxID=37332 RepID=A0ABC8AYK0_9NOCA|nr:ABC transporter ATP-binding protein [Nocardia seriolae]APA99353.1 Iron-chelate-transporting ATPase [Nocardia seriolae]MTJ63258.1 sn-glycerol-3-phosphate ABC transporter ATP-binding protein UgpC [Nocardia seriolae]MTJ72195.1 sn-glycerol-3-phosphate ABC transporter ATP-binding protein UgpC [Nocardia seriolae]MTJ88941.1 sn-glycerol-3-phosphate ABC transporter ATP-binding protein UgpC [Nocardia seriolae]MTK32919.1 sn-glycerol-3-phosphate ABC transporter ATP-binding protein UgpC [Nocardia seriol